MARETQIWWNAIKKKLTMSNNGQQDQDLWSNNLNYKEVRVNLARKFSIPSLACRVRYSSNTTIFRSYK